MSLVWDSRRGKEPTHAAWFGSRSSGVERLITAFRRSLEDRPS